ncbi:PREDICTED: protein HEG homolog 1 [Chrysochloris asiatica]|uniref:Protein HEG homolog 1 n=1 Tax=Chrysochloris asiatica TaxID=185453 RepID=A0A9B0WW68_CHRAS|nr:PREDICTED: protein HEG homolog 1 [Chrysochloris asiatica]
MEKLSIISHTAVRNHWPERNTESHLESITFDQGQVNISVVVSKDSMMVQTPRKSAASLDAPENFTLLIETANAGGRYDSPSRTNVTVPHVGGSPEIATALNSWNNSSALEELHVPTSSHSSESEERIASSQMENGKAGGSQVWGEKLPEETTLHSQVTATSILSQSSLPALDMGAQTTSSKKRTSWEPELSSLNFSRTPAYTPASDSSPSSGSIKEVNNSTTFNSPSITQTDSLHEATTLTDGVPGMLQSLPVHLGPVNETKHFPEDSETASTSASEHSSPSVWDSRRNSQVTGNLGDGDFIEPSTENGFRLTSSEISVGFWQSDSPTFGGHQLASNSDTNNGSSISQTETVSQSSVPSIEGEESTEHWSLINSKTFVNEAGSSTSSPKAVNSSALTHPSDSAPQSERSTLSDRNYSEPSTESLSTSSSENLDFSASRGERSITGISYDQVSSTDTDQRTSRDHTDHTYISSTFTKGERALLSITDNSSSSDVRKSSTSSNEVSNSSHLEYSSSSHAQTERSNASSYEGGFAQPSTESLVMRTPNPPSYTPTINVPNTLVLLDLNAGSADNSSSPSEPPLPLPSVSQSHQLLSSTLPPTGTSAPLLTPTSSPSLSSSPSPLPISLVASTAASSSSSQTSLSHSSSTPVLPRVRETSGISVRAWAVTTSKAMFHNSQTEDPKNQSDPNQKIIIEPKSPSQVSLPTPSAEAVTMSSPSGVPLPPALTESSTEQTLPAMSTSFAQMPPALRATTLETSHPPVTTVSLPSSTVMLMGGTTTVQTTTRKQVLPTSPEILVPQISTQDAVTTKRTQVHVAATTRLVPLTSAPTSTARELATRLGITEEHSPASHFSRASPSPKTTDVSTAQVLTPKSTTFLAQGSTQSSTSLSSPTSVDSCAMNPCLHDGSCIADATSRGYRCMCSPSWRGDDCSVDVNECLSNPCPPLATCNNTQGSFTCKCPVGYQLEKGICSLVRTFVSEFKLKKTFLNTTVESHSALHEVGNEITKTLNMCFSTLPGYTRSTVHASRESSMVVISLQTTFSLASNVTLFDLADRIERCVNSCRSSAEVCQLLISQKRIFRAGSLCKRKSPECDKETSICTDLDGIALCQCKSGYFQFNKMDHSCRACEDGYRLENETCMSCPFGLGGLNCGNPYQLITVVIAAAGGGLLLILGIALIVTCCRKNKNDLSKLIFKSGDFQMSPYAEYPKNPRSQEWGREAIEMHENGSTKNLLQMTDVYYSPTGVRNPELERNGVYPAYTGLPGSRHSCIFPGQYNPSFISDESRRRDYF